MQWSTILCLFWRSLRFLWIKRETFIPTGFEVIIRIYETTLLSLFSIVNMRCLFIKQINFWNFVILTLLSGNLLVRQFERNKFVFKRGLFWWKITTKFECTFCRFQVFVTSIALKIKTTLLFNLLFFRKFIISCLITCVIHRLLLSCFYFSYLESLIW